MPWPSGVVSSVTPVVEAGQWPWMMPIMPRPQGAAKSWPSSVSVLSQPAFTAPAACSRAMAASSASLELLPETSTTTCTL